MKNFTPLLTHTCTKRKREGKRKRAGVILFGYEQYRKKRIVAQCKKNGISGKSLLPLIPRVCACAGADYFESTIFLAAVKSPAVRR